MEFDRRVQIRVRRPGEDKRGFGSGYLVAPRLVLTAAHVLKGASGAEPGAVTVCRPDAGDREFPAYVRWWRTDDVVDAALVEVADGHSWEVPESLEDLWTRPPQRWGHLIGTRPYPVAIVGFPRMQRDPDDGRRLDEQLTGRITPGTGTLAGRYEVSSTEPSISVELPRGLAGTGWSGMSGAALLSEDGYGGDMLCGVTRRDRQATGGTRLTATPTALLLADDGFRAFVTEHSGWEPVLEPVEPAALLTPARQSDLESPAALLRADTEAVTFQGRDSKLAELRTWCEGGPSALSVWVMTGPGGQGKTRLARYLTQTLGREGWVTGHLRSDLTDRYAPPDFAPLITALPLLLVIDYAETRPRLLRRLVTYLQGSRHRVRLLLLARSDGPWRTDTLDATPRTRRILKAAHDDPLAPLIPRSRPTADRTRAFTRAAQDFAHLMPRVPTLPSHDWDTLAATLRPSDDLSGSRYDNALTLQLTALTTLLQHGPAPVETASGAPAEEILLEHEERFWEDSANAPAFKLNLPTPVLKVAVAVAALCGASSKDDALRIISEVPALPADKAALTAAWLAKLYPAEPDRYWGSLQPDRIAEYLVSRALTDGSIPLATLLAAAAPWQQVQLITVLSRAAIAHYNAQRTTDSENVLHALDTALDSVSLHHQTIRAATAALPYPSRITAPLALRLSCALAQDYERLADGDAAAYEPDRALSLSTLGIWLSEVGRRAEALSLNEQAVKIYRRLAAENSAVYEPDLANTLTNLGNELGEVRRHSEALSLTEQAVEIYRRLAADDPAAYEANLALSLSGLGNRLSAVGRHAEALTAEQQAVEIRRLLAAGNPAAYEHYLAGSMTNLGNHLSKLGQHAEALPPQQEAVGIYRRLAAENPAAYEPDLGRSLYSLSVSLSKAGRGAEALAINEQAVEIDRRLATDNPAAYEPDLAHYLSGLGIRLSEVGRHAEALTTTEQAVEIDRRLATDNPTVYEPDLARMLTNLGNHLSKLGRHAEALAPDQEAVEIYRRLAAEDPAAYEPDLAGCLSGLSSDLREVGRHVEALPPGLEALEIYRRLAAEDPAAYEPDLARTLHNLSIQLGEVGRHAEALLLEQETVEIFRRLAAEDPAAYEPDLAHRLSDLSSDLREVGRHAEALPPEQEAVEIYRRLAAEDPAAYEPDLARTLYNLSIQLPQAGRLAEALLLEQQAVQIFRRLAAEDPAAYEPDLARSLSNLGRHLLQAGRLAEALLLEQQAVQIFRRLAAEDPAAYEPDLALSLSNLGHYLSGAGRLTEALIREQQAVQIYRRLVEGNPAAYELHLARSLSLWAMVLVKRHDLTGALRATGDAVEIYRNYVATMPATLSQLHVVLGLRAECLDGLGRDKEAQEVRRLLAANELR
ncbi:tetratricopeptide repeat protein [Streptomyces mirabilis]|uniref:tetratricopeptide repeat protein n=1 Tax=Streptomyces mirabilis TaxID=68239 RepID=UPI00369ADA1E